MGLDTWYGVLFWVTAACGASLALAILAQLLMWWVIVGGAVDGLHLAIHAAPERDDA